MSEAPDLLNSNPPRLTREQAAIIGAYTGIACGDFGDVHRVVEQALGHPVWTHQMADKKLWEDVREKIKPQFVALCATQEAPHAD